MVDLDDLLDQRRARVEPGVGGEHAGGVGQQHEDVGIDEVSHQRRQAVVVTEADLVVGDGVVLVDDGYDPELEQAPQSAPRLEVLASLHEVERGDEHLAGDQIVAGELVAVHLHQPALAHRGHRLQGDRVTRPLRATQTERGKPRADRTAADDHDLVTHRHRRGDLTAELGDRVACDLTVFVGDRRRADLDDDDHASTPFPFDRVLNPGPTRSPRRVSRRSMPRVDHASATVPRARRW